MQCLTHQDVGEVFMGHVLTAGVGQAPAKQAALAAGSPTIKLSTQGTECSCIHSTRRFILICLPFYSNLKGLPTGTPCTSVNKVS